MTRIVNSELSIQVTSVARSTTPYFTVFFNSNIFASQKSVYFYIESTFEMFPVRSSRSSGIRLRRSLAC